jgi:hypothetical protein
MTPQHSPQLPDQRLLSFLFRIHYMKGTVQFLQQRSSTLGILYRLTWPECSAAISSGACSAPPSCSACPPTRSTSASWWQKPSPVAIAEPVKISAGVAVAAAGLVHADTA